MFKLPDWITLFINKFINKLSSLFEEDSGNRWSMMRFLSWYTGTIIASIWGYLSITERKMVDIPNSVIIVFTLVVTGKVGQKIIEMFFSNFNVGVTPAQNNSVNSDNSQTNNDQNIEQKS